jgi:hypothetical protein
MPFERTTARIGVECHQARRFDVTLVWFVVWLISNNIGDKESLAFDPLNWWSATLILVVALDLGRQHATGVTGMRKA